MTVLPHPSPMPPFVPTLSERLFDALDDPEIGPLAAVLEGLDLAHPAHAQALRTPNGQGRTPLMEAACGDHTGHLERLLALDVTLAKQDVEGNTALLWAAREGRTEYVHLLWPASDTNAGNRLGQNVLGLAARGNHRETLDLVIERLTPEQVHHQARALLHDGQRGGTALMVTARAGHLECLTRLLPLSDPTQRNEDGFTALALATYFDRVACAEALVDPDVAGLATLDGDTPFSMVAERAFLRMSMSGAEGDRHWALLDRLAFHEPHQDRLLDVLERAGRERLPQFSMHREAQQLRASLAQANGPGVVLERAGRPRVRL